MPTTTLIHTVNVWRRVADRLDAAEQTVLARQIRRTLALNHRPRNPVCLEFQDDDAATIERCMEGVEW